MQKHLLPYSIYTHHSMPLFSIYFIYIYMALVSVLPFFSPIIMQDHNKSNQRHLRELRYVTLVCHSQALSMRAAKVNSASISHIYM